ncbi:IS3 family transposase [Slackia exigua]|nr:IS3 family transposase [Slackia exigua]
MRAGVSPPVAARRLGVSSGCLVSRWARASRGMPSREDRGIGGPEERTPAGGGERAEWRDWAADLPEDPRERLAALERKRIEMGAALDVLKAPGPGSLSRREKAAAAGAARAAGVSVAAACRDLGLARSMSRKGRSPDNARAGGFFGTLKQEFFYARDWTGVGCEEFAAELGAYIVWYRDRKLKKALGWKTMREHREEMGGRRLRCPKNVRLPKVMKASFPK